METIKIYVVDDNVAARAMLKAVLTGEEDFFIAGEAETGQGAIIMLEEVDPDVVMLEMSIGGGMKINDIIREMKRIKPEVKVILTVDTRNPESVIETAGVGATDFVSKPYKKATICRTVREVVKR